MYISHDVLRLNVGFIIHQTVGYSRDFPFEIPALRLPPDLDLNDFTGVVRVTRTAQGLVSPGETAGQGGCGVRPLPD